MGNQNTSLELNESCQQLTEPLLPVDENISHEDISHEDISHEDISHEDISHEDISHEEDGDKSLNVEVQELSHPDIDFERDLVLRKRGKCLYYFSSSEEDKEEVIWHCNHNVFWTITLCSLYGLADSLWTGTVYVAYVKHLGHDTNGPVGYIEAVSGLAMLLTALPIGYAADRYGRSKVIKGGGVILLLAVASQIGVVYWIGNGFDDVEKNDIALSLLGCSMVLWGIASGIVYGPTQALYADSIPDGKRSVYFNYLFVAYILTSCLGPAVSIMLFQIIGDDWDMNTLRTIIYVGMGVEFISSLLMFLFNDAFALEERGSIATPETQLVEGSDEEIRPTEDFSETQEYSDVAISSKRRAIPYIDFVSSLILAFGSGMTIKFFPLFFKDEVGMTPTQTQIIYVLVPFFMAALSTFATRVSAWLGRVQTILAFCGLGVSLLYLMAFFISFLGAHIYVLVPMYILRTAFINATSPLANSIIMDFVPKNERGRWKGLESVSQFGWCGSAALGGFLADKYDYNITFLVTAILQTFGIVVYATLLPLVPRKEEDLRRS